MSLLSNAIISSWSPTGACEVCGMHLANNLGHTAFCPVNPAHRLLLDVLKKIGRPDIATRFYYIPSLVTKHGQQIDSPFLLADSPLVLGYAILECEPAVKEEFLRTRGGQIYYPMMRDLAAAALFVDNFEALKIEMVTVANTDARLRSYRQMHDVLH